MGFMDSVQKISGNFWQQGSVPPDVAECDKTIEELEKKDAEIITKIGQLYISNNTVDSSEGTPYADLMKAYMENAEQKESVLKKKLALQGLRKCENCGNILSLDSLFCNKCGVKLEPISIEESQVEADGSHCPKCGSLVEAGSTFCTSCGQKLGD